MSITTKIVSSNPVHDEVYSIQHCDKVCQWLATGQWFSPVSSTNKIDRHDILVTEKLLKVAVNKQTNKNHIPNPPKGPIIDLLIIDHLNFNGVLKIMWSNVI